MDIFVVTTVHKSLFAGISGAKQQNWEEKPRDAKAPPAGLRMNTKFAKASLPKDPTSLWDEDENEYEKEEVATHLRGGDHLTGHFTMANLRSDEDNWHFWMSTSLSLPSFFIFALLLLGACVGD